MDSTFAVLTKDVRFELPWGGEIVGKEGMAVRIDPSEHIALLDGYHVELDPSEYKVL